MAAMVLQWAMEAVGRQGQGVGLAEQLGGAGAVFGHSVSKRFAFIALEETCKVLLGVKQEGLS